MTTATKPLSEKEKTMVDFSCDPHDTRIISKIASRAVRMVKCRGNIWNTFDVAMDLTAVHCTSCPLDLEKLLAFPDSDFMHDVAGIRQHIDRETGRLVDCFDPRCSVPVNTP